MQRKFHYESISFFPEGMDCWIIPDRYADDLFRTKVPMINPSGFQIHRGVNLSHWLSQNFGWSPKATFITEQDIKFIDSIGYDHVRIPLMKPSCGIPLENRLKNHLSILPAV